MLMCTAASISHSYCTLPHTEGAHWLHMTKLLGNLHSHLPKLRMCAQMYPQNVQLWGMLAQAEASANLRSRLRRTLAAAAAQWPGSLAIVLATAQCEASMAVSAAFAERVEVRLPFAPKPHALLITGDDIL